MSIKNLIEWLTNNPHNQRRIEQAAGLSNGYISRLKNGYWKHPRLSTLKKISDAIKEIEKKYDI